MTLERRAVILALTLLACAVPALAQQPPPVRPGAITLADVAGTWDGRSMVGPEDSVVATYVLVATADGIGWTMTLPHRDPRPSRVVAVGGDSVVTETGPYPSTLREGELVVTRTTGHYAGDRMTGTFEARYASGVVIRGKVAATRRR